MYPNITPKLPHESLGLIQFSQRISTSPYETGKFAQHLHIKAYHSRRKKIMAVPHENEIIELLVPNAFTWDDARQFVADNEQELLDGLNEFIDKKSGQTPQPLTYDSKVPFFGEYLPIHILPDDDENDGYFRDGAFYVKGGLPGFIIRSITFKRLGEMAYGYLKPKIDHYAKMMGVEYSSLEIDDGRRTFGSYNKLTKVIFLSRRLLMMSEKVIDFLIVHELAHTECFLHSEEHDAEMGKILPDYDECDEAFYDACGQLMEQGWI